MLKSRLGGDRSGINPKKGPSKMIGIFVNDSRAISICGVRRPVVDSRVKGVFAPGGRVAKAGS
jgi:hypothetical protein